jgi:hypothetical protein
MKKVIVASITAFAFFAISTSVLFTSCQKKNDLSSTAGEIKKTRVENGRKYKVYYGNYEPAMGGGFTCSPSTAVCHIVKYYEQDGEPWNTYLDFAGNNRPVRMAAVSPGDPLHNPMVVHPDTYLPLEFRTEHNIISGQILPGAYPVRYDVAHPLGYVDLPYQP